MRLYLKILSLGLTLFISSLYISAASRYDTKSVTDSLYHELTVADNPNDSLSIMGNLFDLLPRDVGTLVGIEMVDVADRSDNPGAALEILRNLANRYIRNDSMLVELYNRAMRYSPNENPDIKGVSTDELNETLTFIKLMRNIYQALYCDDEQRQELLMNFMKTNTLTPPEDIYSRIILQHAVCTLLAQLGTSDLLSEKLDELGELINELPTTAISIRNSYTVHAALFYNENEEYEKSMQADFKTLEGIDALEKHYKSINRKYRNFNANKYVIYTRFLSNFPRLAPHEIEKYYKLAMELAEKDFTSSETNNQYPGPQIYYNMAYKNYATALGYIKKALDNPANKHYRRRLLKYEIECAQNLGDNETLLAASLEYNTILEKYITDRLDDKCRELQVISDTSDITNNYNLLNIEKERAEARSARLTMTIAIIAVIILLVSVIILYRLNHRNRQLVKTLDKSNQALRTESKNLEDSRAELLTARDMAQKANNLKTDFIKNMSYEVSTPLKAIDEYCQLIVDCADASNRKYLERFKSLVELNCELLNTIVNDVLHISEIDSNSVPVHNRSTDLHALCSMVLDGVRHRVSPGVELRFDTASPQISLFTDPQRLHQILLNLLTNAAKFTSKGSITLGYSVDAADEKVIFTVTDTGIGIKPDKSEAIFERFVKLDKETQGAGLGLTISRLLARILGGDVCLDTNYTKGARFVLSLPKK